MPRQSFARLDKYPDEMLSDDAFFSLFKQWWPIHGGLPEELRVIERLAQAKRVKAGEFIFRTLRKVIARGDYD